MEESKASDAPPIPNMDDLSAQLAQLGGGQPPNVALVQSPPIPDMNFDQFDPMGPAVPKQAPSYEPQAPI